MKVVFTEIPATAGETHENDIPLFPKGAECVIAVFDPAEPLRSERNRRFVEKIQAADIIINSYVEFDRALLDMMENCRVISFQSTGYNAVDLAYATEKKICVASIRDYCTQETAENAIAMMLALQRNTINYNRDVQQRRIWNYSAYPGMKRIEGQTMAIIGYGRIGRHVGRIAGKGLGMRVIAYDPYVPAEIATEQGAELVDLDTALAEGDVISVHMNLTNDNRYFFDRETFEKMKKRPIFINEGRGEMVEEEALKWALDTGLLRGAGIDMLESENPDLEHCCLISDEPRDNLIILPHSGFWSDTSALLASRYSVENALNCYYGRYDQVKDLQNADQII